MTGITRLAARLRPFAHLSRAADDPKDDKDKDKNAVDPKDDDKDDKNAVDPKDDDDDDEKNGASDPEDSGPTDEVGDENEPNAEDNDDDDMAKARKAGHAAGLASAKRQGARAERRRVAAIFKSKSAAGRIEQAATLAFTTRLSASEAIRVLATSPREQRAAADIALLHASIPRTRVSPDGGGAEKAKTPGQRLLAATQKLAAQPRPRG